MKEWLKQGERFDDLERNGYRIIQSEGRFCFGMDAVLLSGFSRVKEGECVLDLGTGTGIIPILLRAKTKGKHFTGLEIQPESADMARRRVLYNHLENEINIVVGDLKEASVLFGAASFDVVTSNPPYMIHTHGLVNPDPALAAARHELLCCFEDVVRETAKVLRQNGRFFLVHRPFRLPELIRILSLYKLEPKRMRLVYPYIEKEPNMVLLECVKGGKPRLLIEKPLIIYKSPNVYTDEIYEIYGY